MLCIWAAGFLSPFMLLSTVKSDNLGGCLLLLSDLRQRHLMLQVRQHAFT